MNQDNVKCDILQRLTETLEARRHAPSESSYVARLFSKGEDAILKKVGEEAVEVVLAAKSGDKEHLVYETADLWFHCMVLLAQHELKADDVLNELARREGVSGIVEKESRNNGHGEQPTQIMKFAMPVSPHLNPLPQAGEEANERLREFHSKELS